MDGDWREQSRGFDGGGSQTVPIGLFVGSLSEVGLGNPRATVVDEPGSGEQRVGRGGVSPAKESVGKRFGCGGRE